MPEHPIIIDVYGKHIVVYEYESKHNLSEDAYDEWFNNIVLIIKEVIGVIDENLHLKMRRRKRNREDQYQKLKDTKMYETVSENGHQFLVNFNDFLDTGLFLDHRITRTLVQGESKGKKVLNLFCYTGSFSIYAAKGGASEVYSIDMSNTYIDWGKQNDALNYCSETTKMQWIKADVLQEIKNLPENYFDLVILDPPTFSNSKSMYDYWDVQEHHAALLIQLYKLVTNDGVIYFSNNYRGFLIDVAVEKYYSIKNITNQTTDFDFEGKLDRPCFYLKKK
jgi:23S rRNA (cytosine1962-C5)-methyltransferase